MSTSLIETLFAAGDSLSGKFMRVVGGKRDDTGNAQALLTDYLGQAKIVPGSAVADAFYKIRTSSPFATMSAKQVFDGNTQQFVQTLTGSGTATFNANTGSTALTLTTASGDSVVRQTKMYVPYQPGKSQAILMTAVMGAIKTNVRQRVGYFDASNGVFFEQDGTVLRVTRRTNVTGTPTDNQVSQSSWNIDKLDGTGPSGITLDNTKANIFVIDFQWLGVGIVRMGVAINGGIQYCHQFLNANTLTGVWMSTPALPCRWEITNTGTAASGTTMQQICCTVFSEGGLDPVGSIVSANSGSTVITVPGTTPFPIIGLRLKAAYNRATIYLKDYDFMCTSNNNILVEFWLNGTITGGSWVATTGVASEFNITATSFTTTGATKVGSGFISANGTRNGGDFFYAPNTVLGSDVGGTSDTLLMTALNVSGTNATMVGALTWNEVY